MAEIRWAARSASGYMNNITEGNDTFTWNGKTWTSAKPVGYKPADSQLYIVFQTAYVNSPGDTGNKYHSYSFSGWGTINSVTSDYYPIFNNVTDANNYNQGLEYNINNLIAGTIPEPPIIHNWQSVPSISGKNGISFLSTIQSVYLNNGDPVNNALESYIDFIDDSKVAVLVEQEIDDLTKVTVKYIVPAGTYEYIKLVYKAGSAPTSITDGTAVDILQAAKQVSISGIADGNTYFFKIFTDITESEPYEFTTVRPIGAELFKIDLSTDGHDIMRYDPNKIINVEYSYYGELRPWFNAAQGALTDAEHPSQPTYTISNGELTTTGGTQTLAWAYDVTANQRIIPANCTLWFEFDACFLNGEGYLDWRMYDNQSNEVIYWCWDTKYNFGSGIWYNCQLKASVVNGIINRIEYYIDHTMVDAETNNNIHMLCIDETNPVPLYYITFTTTKSTKLKNMKIYWE